MEKSGIDRNNSSIEPALEEFVPFSKLPQNHQHFSAKLSMYNLLLYLSQFCLHLLKTLIQFETQVSSRPSNVPFFASNLGFLEPTKLYGDGVSDSKDYGNTFVNVRISFLLVDASPF